MMPAPPVPLPFEILGGRRFVFRPAILGLEQGDWTFRAASWSEVRVRNSVTGQDIWIPRRFLDHATGLDFNVPTIRLDQQLEFKNGLIVPHRCRVIEMRPGDAARPPAADPSSPREYGKVIGIRLEPPHESKAARIAGSAVALGVLGCLAVAGYSWTGAVHRKALTAPRGTYLSLRATDDYRAVVAALGSPESERWITAANGMRLHLLAYPERGFEAALVGKTGESPERYAGSIDSGGRVLQSTWIEGVGLTTSLLDEIGNWQ